MSDGTSLNLAAPTSAAPAMTPAEVAPPAPAPAVEVPDLRKRAVRGSVWTVLDFLCSQVLRFGTNLLLVYWLTREVFGLMAVVTMLLQGMQMFSDIGIGPSIIQTKRGADPAFLNTAWTIQVIRGFVLWVVGCILAYPFSLVWYPELSYLVPVASFNAAINGFTATSMFVLNRKLMLGRVSILKISTQVAGVIVMVTWAHFSPTVWALIAGTLFSSVVKMVLSHFLAPGQTNRFQWDAEAVRELVHFGRWITVTTIITWMAGAVDKLMYAALLPAALMGVYWQGYNLAMMLPIFAQQLGGTVGFPALSELYRRDVERFRSRLLHMRFVLVVPMNLALLLLILLAPLFIWVVYPSTYFMAGWIVQVLAINSLAGMCNSSYGHAILATGRTFLTMIAVAAMLVVVTVAPLVGYATAGGEGFITAIGISQWALYPVYVLLAKRCGCWQGRFDLAVLIVSALLGVGALVGSHILMGLVLAWF